MNQTMKSIMFFLGCVFSWIGNLASGQESTIDPLNSEAKTAIAAVRASGGQVIKIAANSGEYEASLHLSSQPVTDDKLASLSAIPQLVWLNLANTKITDEGLRYIATLPLKKLHLEKTQIGDQGLRHLKGLKNLEYLNLYGTAVTDAGLEHLAGLTNLKRLYVWQSGVTDVGIKRLNESLPDLVIIGAVKLDIKTVAPPEEKSSEKDEKETVKVEDTATEKDKDKDQD